MEFQPGVPFVLPLFEQMFRESISESECNEINRFTLLPVGRRFRVNRMSPCGSKNFMGAAV